MAKRRGRGEGTITQRKDGRWEARISLPPGSDGKRKRRTVYGRTRASVADKLLELQSQQRSGLSIEPRKLTLGQYLDDWIEHVAKPRVRASTLVEYRRHATRVKTAAGGVTLANWKPSDIRALWAEFSRAGVGEKTQAEIHTTLKNALNDAVADSLIHTNPFASVARPRFERPTRNTFSPEEMRSILKTVDETGSQQFTALVTLVATTGMRIGEALGLRWNDIDFGDRMIHVRRTLTDKGDVRENPTKTPAGFRSIPLTKRAIDRLRAHQVAAGVVPLGTAIVFTDRKGGWLRQSNLSRREWKPLVAEAEVRNYGWHALRHGHATALLSAGEPIAEVSARLGHANPTITMSIYAHALPDRSREVANRVDEILG